MGLNTCIAQNGSLKHPTNAILLFGKHLEHYWDFLKDQGVKIIKPAEQTFWGGYRGYIADIENNLWEIAYNPFIEMDDKGNILNHH